LLLRALGTPLPGWDILWPALLIAGALASLIQGLSSQPRDTGAVWFGVAGTLAGCLFLYITAGRGRWEDMRELWPVLPAAASLGWLAAWITDRREISSLTMAVIAGAGALVGYWYSLGRVAESFGRQLASWWPLLLIVLGLAYIAQFLVQKR